MLKKLLLRTWVGPLPDWTHQFQDHVRPLMKYGWEFCIINYPTIEDAGAYAQRVYDRLGVRVTIGCDPRKICEFDPALALIYPEFVRNYDFWGHFNLDCAYGRLDRWLPDLSFNDFDIFADEHDNICGPFTIYRNIPKINELFKQVDGWQEIFWDDKFHGFDEGKFSDLVRSRTDVRFKTPISLQGWHSHDKLPQHNPIPRISTRVDGSLYENDGRGEREIMLFHFNKYRQWPIPPLKATA